MGVPQIIMIILLTFSVSQHIIKHGETGEIKYLYKGHLVKIVEGENNG
jgi:hypothetical protein